MYDEIESLGISVTLYRRKEASEVRQLALFCHAGWFEDKGWKVIVPGNLCFYKKHGDSIDTDLSISNALARDQTIIKVVELVARGVQTFDYSLRMHDQNEQIGALWQAAVLAEQAPPDLLVITGQKDDSARNRADKYLRLSEVFGALQTNGYTDFSLYRFYGCRDIQNSNEGEDL